MAFSIQTNIPSLIAQRNLDVAQDLVTQCVERLSSGLRINSAADGAADLAIGTLLGVQVRALGQAQRNANAGVSLLQTADGALSDINNLLARMNELAVESASGGTLTASQRTGLNTEFQALLSEIGRVVAVANFNGQQLIDGSLSSGTTALQVGTHGTSNDQIAMSIAASDTTTLGINSAAVDTVSDAQSAIGTTTTAINTVATNRAGIGAVQSRLGTAIDFDSQTALNLGSAQGALLDTDVAATTALLVQQQIVMQAGVAVLAQANQAPHQLLVLLGK